ncbi:2,3-diphosphoglycerate-dependent phosphoglycerate mutase [Pelagibacteraceae bacterium]|nr:2,3-diphosphoglycerate-dependent phosphoglycerate mutase [Candidatus Pelagibacter bacterium]MDC1254037.1 2,3-diphosphoglycerate-dependent phosphoglycerate mutase [Pelagibacteraceae bacterium]
MPHLILVRHGQSEWNLEKRFTGWVDVDLTGQGKLEACKAGEYIKEAKIDINHFYSSFQLRAINTLKFIQDTLRDKREPIRAWQLNERHYGALTGLNKDEMKEKLGEDKIHTFRRSWDIKPDPLSRNNPYHPLNIDVYKSIPKENIPDTESLKDTYERVMKFYVDEIQEKLKNDKNILISAHGNSIRALCKFLFKLDNQKISLLEIPTGNPLLINLDSQQNIKECSYLDQDRAKDLLVF